MMITVYHIDIPGSEPQAGASRTKIMTRQCMFRIARERFSQPLIMQNLSGYAWRAVDVETKPN